MLEETACRASNSSHKGRSVAVATGDNGLWSLPWILAMHPRNTHQLWCQGKSLAASSLTIALLTWISYQLHLNEATVVLLYLLVVVLQSLTGSFIPSAITAAIAAACLDFFFLPPIKSFRVADPLNIVVLFVFLVTTIVVTHLVSRVRVEAEKARRHWSEVEQLYEMARRLLLVKPDQMGNAAMLKVFRDVLEVRAVCLFDANTAEISFEGHSQYSLPERTREAYVLSKDIEDRDAAVSVRCLRIGAVAIGAIGFEGLRQQETLSAAVPVLAAVALERAHSFRRASHEAAAAQAEVFRTAILDALAHEFKTPLATILAVIGGIRESRRLEPEQVEMAEMIEDETSRLSRLTTRLLQTARLDRDELKPRMKQLDIIPVVERVIHRYADPSGDRNASIKSDARVFEAQVDRQLLDLALTQLLDNAFKYSKPGSAVTIDVGRSDDFISISVTNEGSVIAPEEQHRIFDRFYRGTKVRNLVSGTGLDLYVARKIAAAHGGSLDLIQDSDYGAVVFCLKLPAPKSSHTNDYRSDYLSASR
jgi:two-component system sensor histidine kinase KdpD